MSKPLLKALNGQRQDKVPFWYMRQAGRYLPEYRQLRQDVGSFLDLCYTPDLAEEVTLQPIRRFHPNGAILFADILLIPDALGQNLRFIEGEGPVLDALNNNSDIKALDPARLHDHLAPVYQTVRQLHHSLPKDITLIGFAGAPWTVATYMVQGSSSPNNAKCKRWAIEDGKGFQTLIDVLIKTTIDYCAAQIEAGAEAIQLFDSWAGQLSADQFERWCIEPLKAIVSGLKSRHPGIPVIIFPRGAGILYEQAAQKIGADALSLDSQIPVQWARQSLQPLAALQGNLDPQMVVVGGQPMIKATEAILSQLGQGPFIFNLGHGLVPETPVEHVLELSDTIKNWRSEAVITD